MSLKSVRRLFVNNYLHIKKKKKRIIGVKNWINICKNQFLRKNILKYYIYRKVGHPKYSDVQNLIE